MWGDFEMIPKQYKYETDYRKIPREYLDTNIPKGRGFVKWLAFKTIPEQYQQLDQFMKDQNKTDRPNLFEDQLQLLNEKAYWKIYHGEISIITYWKQGYFYHHEAYIKSINLFDKVLVACNEMSNETIEIPLQDIQNIN
jgi:hypothetical protein